MQIQWQSCSRWYGIGLWCLVQMKLVWTNKKKIVGEEVMVVNATFNNISAISQRSVLLVEETGVTVENH